MKDIINDRYHHIFEFAVITGGSEGIGKAIAEALAKRGYGILLVALPGKTLEQAAINIENDYRVPVHTLGVDLTLDGTDIKVYEWLKNLNLPVSILVNNAGFGSLGSFTFNNRDFYHRLLHINIVNIVGLTRLCIELLEDKKRAYIMNVGSIASFFPMPYKVVYASSKYFIYSFSRALREELINNNIRVSLLCPGPVSTNANVKERIEHAGFWGKLTALTPYYVGEVAVRKMLNGKWLILPGFPAKFYFYIEKITPTSIKQRFIAKCFNRK